MSTASHLEKLNGAQRKAVTYGEPISPKGFSARPLALMAGAGTGKTSTLAHRVAHLAIHGVDPSRILLLTATRQAATDIRQHARDIVKKALNEPLGGVSHTIAQRLTWIGTFHSIGNRLLRHYGKHLKLEPRFTVVDRADAVEFLDTLRTELGLAGKEQFPRRETCLQIYSHRVNTQKSLKETLTQQFPWCLKWEEELTLLFRGYVERKQRCNVLDQDDLLLYWHVMMTEPRLAQHVSRHFDHVLVDDYQDANKLQIEILHALKPDGAGLMVAGDDAQAIAPFRAAATENILGFAARFDPPAETIALAQNYRATQEALDGANALLAEAPRRERKHLLSLRGRGSRPVLINVVDAQSQAESVCSEILKRREANVALRRQAVLFRGLSQSEALEAELLRRNVPYVKYGGFKFLEASHVKDLLALLRWADNPRNAAAARRVLQLVPGFGPDQARLAIEHFEAQQHSFQALQSFEPPQALGVAWRKLIELLLALAEPQRQWPGQTHLAREWYKPHFERLYQHFHTRIGDLDQLELLSGQYPSRERFLTELVLDPPNSRGDEDHLTLATIHAAKGMEWDAVYVLNVADGSLPSEFALSRPDVMEDERRLLYVAMTRARTELLLLAPGQASRFLTEKVRKCFDSREFHGSSLAEGALQDSAQSTLDVGARLKEMW